MIYSSRGKKNKKNKSNRLNLILAIVFLSGSFIIYRLFDLQVMKNELYAALASGQHQVYSKLIPERGGIFMHDISPDGGKTEFPLAINKEFAHIYAVPRLIKNPEKTAEELYRIFDEKETEEEVEEMLDEDEYFAPLQSENIDLSDYKELIEFREIKKELEMEKRKNETVEKYRLILMKKDDPYEPIEKKADEEQLEKVLGLKTEGLSYFREKYRYYPNGSIGSHFLGFTGMSGEKKGNYGLEGFFDEELTGKKGSLRTERSAEGDLIIVNDREFNKAIDGASLYLTINRSIQFEVCRRLEEKAGLYDIDGGSIIVMNPNSGAIMAMCSWPAYDPNRYNEVEESSIYNNPAIFSAYEPGSIFKAITMGAGLDAGAVSPHTIYQDRGFVYIEGWNKPIKNSDYASKGGHGTVDMITVLEESLNTGSIFVMQRTGAEKFARYVKNFGFGEKTGIELETEGLTNIDNLLRKRIRPVEAATASFGQGITATPLQMIAAYAAIANYGILMKPYLVEKIVFPDGKEQITNPQEIRRVISDKAAILLSGMMVNVVDGGHALRAGVKGYYVAGKTGTAQVADKGGYSDTETIHTFVGFAPVERPKFVMLVKLDNPKGVEFSASSAAPLFGELAEFILNYFKVPKER